jgi:hypothetical protein
MSCPNPIIKHQHSTSGGLERIGPLLLDLHPDYVVSKRRMRKVESIECVRLNRERARQDLGFSSRPFVLCGLPVKRPASGCLLHERRNGQFVLQVTGHPSYGLPWGQDRLVPIFLATLAIRQKVQGSHLRAPRRCWTLSRCNRVARSIAVWSEPSSGSSVQPSSSVLTHNVSVPQLSIAHVSTS